MRNHLKVLMQKPESAVELVKSFEDDMKTLAPPMLQSDLSHHHRFSEGVESILHSYRETFQDISLYNRSLLAKVEELTKELREARENERHLGMKILKYNEQHPVGFINRQHFDTYMLTTRDRRSTNEEWGAFVNTFSFDTNPMTLAIYKWIDSQIA
jgi:hypothetical protein